MEYPIAYLHMTVGARIFGAGIPLPCPPPSFQAINTTQPHIPHPSEQHKPLHNSQQHHPPFSPHSLSLFSLSLTQMALKAVHVSDVPSLDLVPENASLARYSTRFSNGK